MFSDPILNSLIKKYPAPHFQDRSAYLYEDLIESIVSQQLSIKAADTIFGRFKGLFNPDIASQFTLSKTEGKQSRPSVILASETRPESDTGGSWSGQDDSTNGFFPTPQQILNTPYETLRTAGLSFQKISYIKSVADAFLSDLIDTQKIKKMSDEEVITTLTQIRGVGKWTAEMILIFTLKRPDVFSIGDLGLRNAITRLYGMTDQQKMLSLAETWAPFRSTASWYLWRSLENKS